MVFDQEWFTKYQPILLLFANSIPGRKTLHIDGNKSSLGKKKINKVGSNYIGWRDGKNQVLEFRTHNKYSKRLFYGLYPIWSLIHQWDTRFANNFRPTWNLGFDTLTAYPDAGSGATTVDGKVERISVDETWSTIRTTTGSNADTTSNPDGFVRIASSTTSNQWANLRRSIFTFDTSAIPDSNTISSATLSFASSGVQSDGLSATPNIAIVAATPASNNDLVIGDYLQLGTTEFATRMAYASWDNADTNYNDFPLNASGLSNISKTGIS